MESTREGNGEGRATLEKVVEALQTLRTPFALYETQLHEQVAACLRQAGLPCLHEAVIAKGCRIDFLVDTVGVEVKKGKPDPGALAAQLRRYAASERISALVVVSQRRGRLPATILGKPVRQVALHQLWGVALP